MLSNHSLFHEGMDWDENEKKKTEQKKKPKKRKKAAVVNEADLKTVALVGQ